MAFPLSPWHRDSVGGCLTSDVFCTAYVSPSAVSPCQASLITRSSCHPLATTLCLQTPPAPNAWQCRHRCPAHTGAGRTWVVRGQGEPRAMCFEDSSVGRDTRSTGPIIMRSFSSMVPLKRGEILLILGCCVCAQGKSWRSCQDLSITESGAGIWERMEGLNCPFPFHGSGSGGSMMAGIRGVPSLAGTDHNGSVLGCRQTWPWLHHPSPPAAR